MNGKVEAESGNLGGGEPALVIHIEPLVLRLPAAGRVLGGITRQTVARLIAEGELEPVMVGGTRMVTRESIEAYIERQKNKARAARAGELAAA
ncbi:helix-turn-helix domain-containing protein [Micromonospora echinospora]